MDFEHKNPILCKIVNEWNIEASAESIENYFYIISEFQSIIDGNKPYVLGRKGTGKTAIGSYIESKSDYNFFVDKLSFKNFPFHLLYELEDSKYGNESRFITLWMTLIYLKVCKLLVKNVKIKSKSLDKLKDLYPGYLDDNLENVVQSVSSWDLSANAKINEIVGVGIGLGTKYVKTNIGWSNLVNNLEDVIKNCCDDSKYYITFDELDENYRNITAETNNDNYLPLVTSLFKAIQKIRTNLKGLNVFPIVFLRNDIYNHITDSDKNKWSNSSVVLDWSDDILRKTIAFRIAKADGKKNYNFNKAWNCIIDDDAMLMRSGNDKGKNIESWEFVRDETMMKPRDFIKYLQCCSNTALKNGHYYIKLDDIYKSRLEYSKYLKQEISDELTPILPYLEVVWKTLADICKQIFSTKDFVTAFNTQKMRNLSKYPALKDADPEMILEELFEFSIIGNQNRANQKFAFKYKNIDLYYSSTVKHVIHHGLLKALNIQ